jgi:hypothetical protein
MPGFLGATSFSAVLNETQDTLTSTKGFDMPATMPCMDTCADDQSATDGRPKTLHPRNMDLCLKILTRLPDLGLGRTLFLKHRCAHDPWLRQVGLSLWEPLWQIFHFYLSDRSDIPKLKELAYIITANTEKILREDHDDPGLWVEEFAGKNIRWDVIGILFTHWASGCVASSEPFWKKSIGLTGIGRRQLMVDYFECATACVSLCSRTSNNNSILALLLYKCTILQSLVTGDASLPLWRQHSNLVSSITFMGLHSVPETAPYIPTISSEVRRRTFCQIFVIDKVIAAFNGRPPIMSRRYCTTPMPLDLCDEVILSSHEELIKATRNLDANGWNREGKVYSTTIIRARYLLARIRDAILETTLANSRVVPEDVL